MLAKVPLGVREKSPMLQITKEGRATVASLEFAEQISQIIAIWHRDGESEEDIENMARLRIAVALIERDGVNLASSDAEAHELVVFMYEHFDEIESAFDK